MDIDKVKKHLEVYSERDNDLISDYIEFAEERIKRYTGMKEEHVSIFKDSPNYRQALIFYVQHFYAYRLPVESLNVESQYTKMGLSESLIGLHFDYIRWVSKNGDEN